MAQVNFRIDDEIKANAEKALNDMGLTMSAAITMFLVKVGREREFLLRLPQTHFTVQKISLNSKDASKASKMAPAH